MTDPRKLAARSSSDAPKVRRLEDQFDEASPVGADLAQGRAILRKLQGRSLKKPSSTRVITVANQKGGVGKTTSAVNIAAALATGGLKVVVIDGDPQGNASTALGAVHEQGTRSVYDVVVGGEPLASVLQDCPEIENLRIAPSNIDLSSAEIELIGIDRREHRLRTAVDQFIDESGDDRPDYIIIDSPPSLGLLTLNALVAGREVLIPIQTEYYALEGLTQLMKSIEMVRERLNPDVRISTILLTMFDKRTNLAQEVASEVRSYFPNETLSMEIPRNVRISEAPSFQQSVMTYDPRSSGAIAYLAAAHEIADRAN